MSSFNNSGHYDRVVLLQGTEGPIHIGGAAPPDLEAAQKRLAELPLDNVPDPAPLSGPHRLIFEANPLFVGRDPDLQELARRLKAGGTTAIVPAVVATGMGGLGKTQLATEFAHRYGRYFAGGVFWVTMTDATTAEAEVAACAAALGRTEGSIGEKAEFVLSVWSHALPRLLIFDNCEDEALLCRWRPKGGASRLLVTARRQEWSVTLGVTPYALAVLSRPDAVAMLRGYRPDLSPDNADLNAIATELGDLPLALHMAGSYLYRYRHNPGLGSPAAYLAALRAGSPLAHASLKGCREASPTGYNRHVADAFALSYERLDPTDDALARKLLAAAACCAPGEPIPRWLLTDTAARLDPAPAAEAVEDALARLVELGLVKLEEQGDVTLHRLLAAFVGVLADVAVVREPLWKAALARAEAQVEAGNWALLIAWEAQFEWLVQAADEAEAPIRSKLLDCLGIFYQMNGRYAILRPELEQALRINKASHDGDHPTVAIRLTNLAITLLNLGLAPDARPLLERALKISEAVYGPDHPTVATSLSNLARVLSDLGLASEARSLLDRALRIAEAEHGPDHPTVAIRLGNLALVLKDLGLAYEARPLLERALRIDEAEHGPDHPAVAVRLGNLASVLSDLGLASEARPLLERALRIDEAVHGPDHPTVAIRLSNLATVLRDLGLASEARPLLERALRINEAVHGPDHPLIAIRLSNLAMVLKDLGLAPEARPLLERSLLIDEAVHGPDHPMVASSLSNLASVLRALGLPSEARPLLERAVSIATARLGPDHPHTIIFRNNLRNLPPS